MMKRPEAPDPAPQTRQDTAPRPVPDGGSQPPRKWLPNLLLGLCMGLTPLAKGEGLDVIPIDDAPVFLLSGVSPNLVMTLDSSASMSAAHGDASDSRLPEFDARDNAALTNRLYYDPFIVYLPPVGADKQPFDHADFTAAPRDFFRNTAAPSSEVDCTLDLGAQYAPLWDENYPPCLENPDGKVGEPETGNLYAVDRGNPTFDRYYLATRVPEVGWSVDGQPAPPAPSLDQAKDWALYCLYGVPLPAGGGMLQTGAGGADPDVDDESEPATSPCPAFYNLWDPSRTYIEGDLQSSCGALDPDNLSADQAALAVPACLDRIVVGTDEDIDQVESMDAGIHAARAALLANPDESGSALDARYKKTLSKRNFANWYTYYRNRWRAVQTAVSRVTATLDTSVRVAYQNADDDDLDDLRSRFGPFDGTRREAFQTWLFGTEIPATDETRLIEATLDVEGFCGSDLAYLQDPAGTLTDANPLFGCRNNFHLLFTDGVWQDRVSSLTARAPWLANNDGTGVSLPAERDYARTFFPAIGAYDPNDPAVSIFADRNTGGLADAVFHAWVTDLRPAENDVEHRVPTLIWDPTVPRGGSASDIFWNPANDPADWQHVTTYTVGLGLQGEVRYPQGTYGGDAAIATDGFPGDWNAVSGTASGTPRLPNDQQRVDDLWHAGINGRGGYSSANNPAALIESIQQVMDKVSGVADESAATAAPALNTGSAGTARSIFLARFSSADWTGDVRAYEVSGGLGAEPCPDANKAPGELCGDAETGYKWSAADRLDGNADEGITATFWTNRHLATGTRDAADGTGSVSHQGLPFSRDGVARLSAADSATLLGSVDGDTDEALAVVDYISGKRDYESLRRAPTDPFTFRDRTSLLGDIINGGPVVVSAPHRFFNDPTYVAYASSEANRTEIVYAGANDGLLHGFDASDGVELFAYVPRPLQGKLAILTDPAYGGAVRHSNFVDGPVAEGDAYFPTARRWYPVVVGALGLGAQGVYAIRSPTLTPGSTLDPTTIHLWDFTDEDDPDMGYAFGKPAIVRVLMSDGSIKWVAVFGNGYNSSENVGIRAAGCEPDHASDADACGRAVLYVVDIETGRLVAKFDTRAGRDADPLHTGESREPNGLGQPTVIGRVLTDGEGNQAGGGDPVATVAYAGDLFGNLWRFDLRGLSITSLRGADPTLVFRAEGPDGAAQPITAPVVAAPHPTGVGTMILFGTGRYLALTDVTDTSVQTFYGIWDLGESGGVDTALVLRSQLLAQQIEKTEVQNQTSRVSAVVSEGRTSSRNPVDWSIHKGWSLDLIETQNNERKGERVVQPPQIRGDRVLFVSLIPDTNPCKGGGESWINAVAYASGAALDETPFDFDLNGVFDSGDLLAVSDSPTPVPGTSIRLAGGGIYSGSAALPLPGGDTKTLISSSEGELIELRESSALRWRVWQQLR